MNPNYFSADKERLLNTLARFDGNISVEDVVDSGKTKVHPRQYHTFFLHVLLENVCKDIEPDEQKREILFNEVTKTLTESKLLNSALVLDSLLPLRRKVAHQFFNFVKQIHTKAVPDPTESSITVDSIFEESDFSTKLELQYRYKRNFEELGVIAKGGFGTVCKARHKVTDIVYAVKKVIFKYKSDSEYLKVIREAKSIAAVNHSNIVSYNNAWIECLRPSDEYDSDESSSKSSSSESDSSSEESDTDVIEDHMLRYSEAFQTAIEKENKIPSHASSFSDRFMQRNGHQKSTTVIFSENFSFNENSISSLSIGSKESSSSKDVSWNISENNIRNRKETCRCTEEISSTWDPNHLNVRVMLCIQMEYCDCDLRLWLDKRAEGQELPFNMDVMRIFNDILKGVACIHSKNIIHRDLKPQNIFFSKTHNVLKIGDFGLATLTSANDRSGKASNKHSANLGTVPYAAPEQIKLKSYDSKVDIYSLGIILIELLNTFSTKMEFFKAIEEILKGVFPAEMEKNWPLHINLVKNLVKKNPEARMSAKEILSELQSLENSESSEVTLLKVALSEKEREIVRLKAQQIEKEEEIARLKVEKEEEIARLKAENEEEIARLKAEKEEEIARLKASVAEQQL